jgi:hypothetical protein
MRDLLQDPRCAGPHDHDTRVFALKGLCEVSLTERAVEIGRAREPEGLIGGHELIECQGAWYPDGQNEDHGGNDFLP